MPRGEKRMWGKERGYWRRPAVASILYTPQLIKNNNKVVVVEEDERDGHFGATLTIYATGLNTINIYKNRLSRMDGEMGRMRNENRQGHYQWACVFSWAGVWAGKKGGDLNDELTKWNDGRPLDIVRLGAPNYSYSTKPPPRKKGSFQERGSQKILRGSLISRVGNIPELIGWWCGRGRRVGRHRRNQLQ